MCSAVGTAGEVKMNDRTLTAIFKVAGVRNGYDEVHAEFSPFRDFKVKWTRSYRWISLEVSDYLKEAPEEVITSLANTVFRKIRGEEDTLYTDEVCRWVSSEEFLRVAQPVFVCRFRGLSKSTVGERKDLAESYSRLVERGLVERDPDVFLGWSSETRSRTVGRSSVLMKVVAMSSILDDDMVSDEVLDYCLYTQLVYVGLGFSPTGTRRGVEYEAELSRYPDRAGMEHELRRIGVHI